jgi:hypothetical protein
MKGIGAVAVISIALWSAIDPSFASWVYVACFVLIAQAGFMIKVANVPQDPVATGEPPYRFDREEAEVVQRYRYYFTYPESAGEIGSTLAAMGFVALMLSPWLAYKGEWIQAVLIGAHVILIGPLTRKLAPVYTLRVAAHKGDALAARLHDAHDRAWAKIRAAREKGTSGTL